MVLYDLNPGDTFRWQNDFYRLLDHGEHGVAHAKRIATYTQERGWQDAPPLLNNNFNAYAEIEPGKLSLRVE